MNNTNLSRLEVEKRQVWRIDCNNTVQFNIPDMCRHYIDTMDMRIMWDLVFDLRSKIRE